MTCEVAAVSDSLGTRNVSTVHPPAVVCSGTTRTCADAAVTGMTARASATRVVAPRRLIGRMAGPLGVIVVVEGGRARTSPPTAGISAGGPWATATRADRAEGRRHATRRARTRGPRPASATRDGGRRRRERGRRRADAATPRATRAHGRRRRARERRRPSRRRAARASRTHRAPAARARGRPRCRPPATHDHAGVVLVPEERSLVGRRRHAGHGREQAERRVHRELPGAEQRDRPDRPEPTAGEHHGGGQHERGQG